MDVSKRGMQGGDHPGDWECPDTNCLNHTKLVFGKHESCPACGTAKNAKQAGDWLCPNSSCLNARNLVFARKSSCPKCGALKPPPRRGAAPAVRFQAVQQMQRQMSQPVFSMQVSRPMPGAVRMVAAAVNERGDWQCPNVGCLNHEKLVFGKNQSYPNCGAERQAARPMGGRSPGKGGGGDWQCPNDECINHQKMVFARHAACPNCGSGKASERTPRMMMPMRMAVQHQQPMGSSNPGDWQCPDTSCLNHRKLVWAKNDSCPKCGSEKPADGSPFGSPFGSPRNGHGSSRNRGGSNPDDWQCPNEDCLNHTNAVFAKHLSCPKCGMEKPDMDGMGMKDEDDAARSRSPRRGRRRARKSEGLV